MGGQVSEEFVEVEAPPGVELLTAHDRCDRCSSQAFFLVSFATGALLFCRHHYLKYEDVLVDTAQIVIDESYKINRKSESSA